VEIIFFPQDTPRLFNTGIADVRWFIKLVTQLFLEILAQTVAKIACGAAFRAVGLIAAKIVLLAVFTFHAPVADAVRRIFIALYCTGANLAGHGRCTFPKTDRNSFEGYALTQTLLNLLTFRIGEMLVFNHDNFSFSKIVDIIMRHFSYPL
jgi:hypothetical protein